ncbi:MAG: 2-oxo acid dehydrogenase subunit E2 [Bdellovibrionaceae bacterium]|nr:2-oxo acid dehydrogenase subunit E2 [Pseudobdellovibrionaceae bacterium]NUM60354.1 2-oxo acid dehydrogenase subunit E2 [Pseudobdellovibrionaceae bacterium]
MSYFSKVATTNAERTSWRMNNALEPAHMVTMTSLVSAENLHKKREILRSQGRVVPSYTALVIRAVAITVKHYPEANRAILGLPFFKQLYQFSNIDICVAVEKSLPALPGQAYAALITKPLEKSIDEITIELKKLVDSNEQNDPKYRLFMSILKYVPTPLSNLIINITYLHPYFWLKYRGCAAWVNSPSKAGADLVMTTWPWPLTFSFGKVEKRPLVIEDSVKAALTIPLLLSFDRRIMGGGPASRLFAKFTEIIETGSDELFY